MASVTQTQAPLITHQQTPSCWVGFVGEKGWIKFSVSADSFFQHDSRHHRYAQLVYIRFPRTINCMRSWILWNLIFLISEISTRLWAFGPGEKNKENEAATRSVRGERSIKWEGELGMIIRFKQVIWTTMVLIKLLFINCWYWHKTVLAYNEGPRGSGEGWRGFVQRKI